ncbi:multicopper oxidase family protein [Brevibacillus sp. WF146]|nr:multicopper oxidase family protein [Brevibacillus sp. WF146]UYZ11658.1 multicopper oxidase family protein [Brevibacillus sp. WF146]
MKRKIMLGAAGAVILAALAVGVFLNGNDSGTRAHAQYMAEPVVTQENGRTVRSFELVAKEADWPLSADKMVRVWAYNGVVPGSQIRAKVGDVIRVTLKNELAEPTSIHWHGYPVPNGMDGIPGITQNAVRPGETFTYEFEATVPGTYWYHSHQDSANQVDRGLYGTLVVEEKEEQGVQRDYTLVLDEWNTAALQGGGTDHGGMNHGQSNPGRADMSSMSHGNMNHGSMSVPHVDHGHMGMASGNGGTMSHGTHGSGSAAEGTPGTGMAPGAMHDRMMREMYTTFTVNGKSGAAIEPLEVAKGERVRLRFVNAGFQSHVIHLHGQEYAIVSTDGQSIQEPPMVKDRPFTIAPGERYDVEFVAHADSDWVIESHDESDAARQMVIPVKVKGGKADSQAAADTVKAEPVDIAGYGQAGGGAFDLSMTYDVEYRMELGETMGRDGMEPLFTINGRTYPDIKPLQVKPGDKVKVTLVNKGSSDHPMHLHGHFFQVLSRNGTPLSGAPLMKDTLNVKPGESYVVAFAADNPGEWMFHCHDLHHAAAGMVSTVHYEGSPKFVEDPAVGNNPH